MIKTVFKFWLFFYLLFVHSPFYAQQDSVFTKRKEKIQFKFVEDTSNFYSFDFFQYPEWKYKYEKFSEENIIPAFKLQNKEESDLILLKTNGKKIDFRKLKLLINDKQELDVTNFSFNDSTLFIKLPQSQESYSLKAFWKNKPVAILNVDVFFKIQEQITIIPLGNFNLSKQEIEKGLNQIYQKVNIHFSVDIDPLFKTKVFDEKTEFSNPNTIFHQQYTGQMRLLRDLYFKTNTQKRKKSILVFVINDFKDSSLSSYMVFNKSIGFIVDSLSSNEFISELSQTLGFGLGGVEYSWSNNGPEKGTTNNFMDTLKGKDFAYFQWRKLHKLPNYYSYFDNEENVKTNNGTVGYYFWEEDENGNVILKNNNPMLSIKRPFKFNFLSYRFKVKYALLKPFFKIKYYYVSILDGILLFISLLILWYARKKLKDFWTKRKWKLVFVRRFIFFLLIVFVSYQVYQNYWLTNRLLFYFKHIGGELKELEGLDYNQTKKQLLENQKLLHEEIPTVCSEILINKENKWYIKKRGKVLYFDVFEENGNTQMKFNSSSDSIKLSTLHYYKKAYRHYVVLNYRTKENKLKKQLVFTHSGVDISAKLEKEDKPKRILLFVNGYRPTSIGQTFEENFYDIQINGIEYPNSSNNIYDFDRYDYWTPWNQINLLFQKRINPSNTYYADGHFSVSTSNYKSLINFSSVSTLYPKRCKDSTKHHCYKIENATWKQFLLNQTKTLNQLKMKPNTKGFNYRKYKGRIAGKNLLQIINEMPGLSKNDTLYVVAHSMGYAYSEGIISELKGKINFGGYYIIAPENPQTGTIDKSEWKQVWQYGSNFDQKYHDAPCLQDGIAPQYAIKGLNDSNRIFIPRKYYNRKGYFDSHFIGYYTWIFDIPKNEKGFISAH